MENTAVQCWNAFERLLKFAVFKLLKMKMSEKAWADLMQFIKFGIVGFSNTVIGYLIYVAALSGLRAAKLWASADIYVAQLVSFLLSVAWSFTGTTKWCSDRRRAKTETYSPH